MRYFCLVILLSCACCIGCKNKSKDQNGSNIPVLDTTPRLHSMVDVDFVVGERFKDAILWPKIQKISNLKRTDEYMLTTAPEIEGRTHDTLSIYSNSMDTIVIWRLNSLMITRLVLRSPNSGLVDDELKVGASKDIFKDRFPNIMDNDTIEITDLEGFVAFRAILAGGRIKIITYEIEY